MIYVVGLGPGCRDYILPAAVRAVKEADLVIGAKRNLEAVAEHCHQTMDLSVGFDTIADCLKTNTDQNLAVVVSGDTGFHSMLAFVKRHVDHAWIEVIPGISSLQYLYSRINKSYEQSQWLSLHGRRGDLDSYIKRKTAMGILTDKAQNNRFIAARFRELGVEEAILYVGERLSYPDEKITRLTVEEALDYVADPLSVVVVDYE